MFQMRNRDQIRIRERTYAFGHNPLLPSVCLHIITFGVTWGPPFVPMPVLCRLDCRAMQPPPRHLLDMYTGASATLAHAFFSIPGHETIYRDAYLALEDELGMLLTDPRLRPGGCVAMLINCTAGMHRSVAMAERAGERCAGFLARGWSRGRSRALGHGYRSRDAAATEGDSRDTESKC